MEDEHLPVAARPGADADGRGAQGRGDLARERLGDAFEDDREDTGALKRRGVAAQLAGRLRVPGLHLESTEPPDPLGSQSQVAHDRDPGLDQVAYHVRVAAGPLDLHGVGARTQQHRRAI